TSSCASGLYIVLAAPFAGAVRIPSFTLWREHVIVHADHHGNENDRVIEKMQFYTGKEQLQHAARHRFMPEVVVGRGLVNEQKVLNVMPELDYQRDRPPSERSSGKTLPKHPNPDQHDQSVAIMQGFCLNKPWPNQSKQSQCLWTRPVHDPDLIGLNQMLHPVSKHDDHEDLQRPLMPGGIQLLVKRGIRP